MNAFVQNTLMRYNICRVAGHKEVFHPRANDSKAIRQVTAIHLRHDHISQEEMNFIDMFLCQLQRLTWACRAENGIPQAFE